MRVGILCSAGGSALLEVAKICPHVEFRVLTDRACGVETGCREQGIPCHRIEWSDRASFSAAAHEVFGADGGCDFVVMFFSRLVSAPLVGGQRLLNVHPALLPAFAGMNAVARTRAGGVRFFGATLHVADEQMDAGPIIAQACQPVSPGWSLDDYHHLSFLHKTALLLLAIETSELGLLGWKGAQASLRSGWHTGDRLNPMLTTPGYLAGLRALQRPGLAFL
jgi:phosphoribosylglycinamide formyltransferase 1